MVTTSSSSDGPGPARFVDHQTSPIAAATPSTPTAPIPIAADAFMQPPAPCYVVRTAP